MKITVGGCLELQAFEKSVIMAGKENLSNRITSVSVVDAVDAPTAVKNNGKADRLILTSFYGIEKKDKIKKEIIEGLAEKGIAGMVVFHTEPDSPENKVIVETADKLGLPLIIIPESAGICYAEAIEQIMDRIFYSKTESDDLINSTIYHLLNFEKYTSFPVALREAALAGEFQVVLLSKNFNPVLAVETRHKATIQDAVRTLKEHEKFDSKIYSLINVEGVFAYWGSISIGKDTYMLLIVDNEGRYMAGEITKLAEIIQLAIGMWKYTPERDVKAEFIKALTRGNKSLAYYLKDEMEIDADNIISVFLAREIDNFECEDEILKFQKKEGFEVMNIQEGEETFGVIIKNRKEKEKDFEIQKMKADCLNLYDKLKSNGKSVRIFHSTGVDGIEGAADGFKLISETDTFVEYVFPYKRVFTKYELVLVSNCINIQVQGGYLYKNYEELLEAFDKEMGENKAKQLLDTLETFVLDAGMNSAKTSEFMGIHTNTVQYRLKKINEVLGAEITGNRVIPGLTIALALKRLERSAQIG